MATQFTGSLEIDGSLLINGAAPGGGLEGGTGTDSLASALTSTPAVSSGIGTIALGNLAIATGDGAVAIGANAEASSDGVAIGDDAEGFFTGAVAIGEDAKATQWSISIGANTATNTSGTAVGTSAQATGMGQGTALGSSAGFSASGFRAIVIGADAGRPNGDYGISISNGVNTNSGAGNISIGRVRGTNADPAPTQEYDIQLGDTFKYDHSELRVTLNSAITSLPVQPSLPTNGALGDLTVVGTALYFHDGTSWTQIS